MDKPIIITTPIFYVNSVPHIGHLYTTLLADALSRYLRLIGNKTIFTTGTDEHGLKVKQSADKKSINVKDFCDEISNLFRSLFNKANIQYDDFIRTTENRHKEFVKKMWNDLQNDIYLGDFEGWYNISDEEFVTNVTDTTGLILIKEPNYFFKLSKYKDKILEWLETNPIYPQSRKNEMLQFLRNELKDLSISRLKEKIEWGIEVPNNKDHLIYVWLDALTNYLTVSREFWPADYHIIGKDIVKFHSIYWPAFLMSSNHELPKRLIVHSHWTMNKEKISKSKGNVIDPFELLEKYDVDFVRYYLLREGKISDDCDFSYDELSNKLNSELSNVFGNLITRTLSKKLNPTLEWPKLSQYNSDEKEIIDRLNNLPDIVDKYYRLCEFGKGIAEIMIILKEINNYYSISQPWKSKNNSTILYIGLESIRISSLLLYPIMPTKIGELLEYLNIPNEHRNPLKYRFGYDYSGQIPDKIFIFYNNKKKK